MDFDVGKDVSEAPSEDLVDDEFGEATVFAPPAAARSVSAPDLDDEELFGESTRFAASQEFEHLLEAPGPAAPRLQADALTPVSIAAPDVKIMGNPGVPVGQSPTTPLRSQSSLRGSALPEPGVPLPASHAVFDAPPPTGSPLSTDEPAPKKPRSPSRVLRNALQATSSPEPLSGAMPLVKPIVHPEQNLPTAKPVGPTPVVKRRGGIWPENVPSLGDGLKILNHPTLQADPTWAEPTKRLLEQMGPEEKRALAFDAPDELMGVRRAVLIKWRSALALHLRPAPDEAIEAAALKNLFQDIDAVLEDLPLASQRAKDADLARALGSELAELALELNQVQGKHARTSREKREIKRAGRKLEGKRQTLDLPDGAAPPLSPALRTTVAISAGLWLLVHGAYLATRPADPGPQRLVPVGQLLTPSEEGAPVPYLIRLDPLDQETRRATLEHYRTQKHGALEAAPGFIWVFPNAMPVPQHQTRTAPQKKAPSTQSKAKPKPSNEAPAPDTVEATPSEKEPPPRPPAAPEPSAAPAPAPVPARVEAELEEAWVESDMEQNQNELTAEDELPLEETDLVP